MTQNSVFRGFSRCNQKFWKNWTNSFSKVIKTNSVIYEVRINIERNSTNGKRQCYLTPDLMHPFLGMHEGLEDIAFLLTADTGDAGTSPHVARSFFNYIP